MSYLLRQSQTSRPLLFLLVLSSDHLTGATGLSPTVTLSKNGAIFAAPVGAVTEVGNGFYKVAGNATDTATLGPLLLHATGTGADPCDVQYEVVAFDPEDGIHLGVTALPNVAAGANGGLPTGNGSGQVAVASIAANAITAAAIATDAIDADALKADAVTEIQSGLMTSAGYTAPDNASVTAIKAKTDLIPASPAAASDIPSAAAIAAAVWGYATRTLTSLSALTASVAASVWAYATRTLTQSAAQVAAAVAGADLTVRTGTTFTASLTGLGNITGRTRLWFTAKVHDRQPDAESLVQLEETGGLLRLAGAAPSSAALGSIVVTDAVTGAVTLTLDEAATLLLPRLRGGIYDLKWRNSAGDVLALAEGKLAIVLGVTDAVS